MARNSWLIALVCVIGDVSALLVFDELAARIGAALLLGGPDVGVDGRVGNATGLVAAGYLAGAWLRGRWSWVAPGALVLGARWTAVPPELDTAAVLAVEALTNALLPWPASRCTSDRIAFLEEVKRKRRDAEEQVARALAEERGALARELHDTISHHVSAIGVHAGPDRLPDSLDVAAYRVAQELLTNALRHGDGERVELRITQSAAELVVSVVNGVRPGPPARGTRRGLDGVRRRAALFCGGVVCGPGGGSWRATATFPREATPRQRSWPPGRPPGCCC